MIPSHHFCVLRYARLPQLPAVPPLPHGITVRTFASPDDIPAYTEALNRVFQNSYRQDEVASVTREPHFNPELWFFAYNEQDEMIGFCTCYGYRDKGEIEFLGILPQYRGQGLGSMLLAMGIRALAGAGYEHIQLAVNVKNENALQLYTRMGFERWRRPPCRCAEGLYIFLSLGSNASRSPSPSILKPSTAMIIARPGKTEAHGAEPR